MFWCEKPLTYGLALDGDKRLCRVRTSNAGQCLFSRIATPDRAVRGAQTLLALESFSGWGIRSVAASEQRYNPMGYHTGSVWPHDNALIACGLARYRLAEEALRVFAGLFDAGSYFDLHRIPELFCGFPRDPGECPFSYPVACAPQAWSVGALFLFLQACLGLRVSGSKPELSFVRPTLPAVLGETRILNLQVANAEVDLLLTRHDHDVTGKVLRREGDVEIMVLI
jgi:glycogen debranching enzyme